MGMYDYIKGHTRCGYCGNLHEIDEQTKIVDYKNRTMGTYIIGDFIPIDDGRYYRLSGVRDAQYVCEVCNNENYYALVVKNGRLISFETDSQPFEVRNKVELKIFEDNRIKTEKFFKEIAEIKERNRLYD